MKKIDEIMERINNFVESEIKTFEDELSKSSDVTTDEEIVKKLKILGKEEPYRNHSIKDVEPYAQGVYMTALYSIINEEKDEQERYDKDLFFCKILASFDGDVNLEEYILKTYKIDMDYIGDFLQAITGDLRIAFAIDALLISYYNGNLNKHCLDVAMEYIEFFGFDKEMLADISTGVRAVLSQEFSIDIKLQILKYLVAYIENSLLNPDFATCHANTEDLYFVGYEFTGGTIVFGKYASKKMIFINCTFKGFSQITDGDGNGKTLVFDNCVFKNLNTSNDRLLSFRNSNNTTKITGCKFIECAAKFQIIYYNYNLVLENCVLEKCKYTGSSKSLIYGKKSSPPKNCTFVKCTGNEIGLND